MNMRNKNLKPHHFISTKQTVYLNECKNNIQEQECLVIQDFAENYTFITQDEIQAAYWNSKQCTIHPVIIYYRASEELEHKCVVIVSESLKHDINAVHLFNMGIIDFIKSNLPKVKHIKYFSDGCPGQYKNKFTLFNLCK